MRAQGSTTPSQRRPHFQRLSDAEKRQIIKLTTNFSPTNITPYLTLTTFRPEVQDQGFLAFGYPQRLDAGIAYYDGNLPDPHTDTNCNGVFGAEGLDLYFYAQPDQRYFIDMIIAILNGSRVFRITQWQDGQPGPSNDIGVGLANQNSISHVPVVVDPCPGGCWHHLQYKLEPDKDKSEGGPWIFAEIDISNYN